jgi:hypothetical protein
MFSPSLKEFLLVRDAWNSMKRLPKIFFEGKQDGRLSATPV